MLLETVIVAVTAARCLSGDEDGLHELYFSVGRSRNSTFFTRLLGGMLDVVVLNCLLFGAAVGGFCPLAAYIAVALVTCWWIFPEKRKKA